MPPRPLSPHLGVYKFMYTMSLSILYRITGIAASLGFLLFVAWLMALASGHDSYQRLMALLQSPLAKLLLVGFTFSFVYHFCNGIRHLGWDLGYGFEKAVAKKTGTLVLVAAIVLTLLTWWCICARITASSTGGLV